MMGHLCHSYCRTRPVECKCFLVALNGPGFSVTLIQEKQHCGHECICTNVSPGVDESRISSIRSESPVPSPEVKPFTVEQSEVISFEQDVPMTKVASCWWEKLIMIHFAFNEALLNI